MSHSLETTFTLNHVFRKRVFAPDAPRSTQGNECEGSEVHLYGFPGRDFADDSGKRYPGELTMLLYQPEANAFFADTPIGTKFTVTLTPIEE